MIHQAVQFLATASKSVLPARFDDSHTSFTWDFNKKCFASEWLHTKRTFRLEFNPSDLSLHLASYGEQAVDSIQLVGKTKKDVYALLQHMLIAGGITLHRLTNEMHYDLPEHEVCRGGKYRINSGALNEEVVKHYSNAYLMLNLLKGKNPAAGLIRCWPHHFDIATDFIVRDQSGNSDVSFAVGFSPANPDFPEPHFYFIDKSSGGNTQQSMRKLKYGKWLPLNINGTCLGLQKLIKKTSSRSQVEILSRYFNESYAVLQGRFLHAEAGK
jgi:hypothetical protein